MYKTNKLSVLRALAVAALVSAPVSLSAQELQFAVHADPVISWMGSNESCYRGEGVKAGFDIGLNVFHFFADNFAISSGLSFLSAGGRQSTDEEHTLVFTNFPQPLDPGTEVRYNIHYLNIPAGIRFQPDQVGYLTYFTDLGFDIRMRIKSTIDVPAIDIRHENARNEVYGLNAGWHIGIGIEYELAIDASIVAGLGYAQDFFDITKDLEDANQPDDRSGIRMVKIRLGLKF